MKEYKCGQTVETFKGSDGATGSLDFIAYCCCWSSNSALDMISTVSLLSLGRDFLLLTIAAPPSPSIDADSD